MWKDVIELVSETLSTNSIGDVISIETPRQVFANKKSIRQSEYYLAAANGLRPEIMFEVRLADYNNEDLVNYNGKPFFVIRRFSKNDEIVELICEGDVDRATT